MLIHYAFTAPDASGPAYGRELDNLKLPVGIGEPLTLRAYDREPGSIQVDFPSLRVDLPPGRYLFEAPDRFVQVVYWRRRPPFRNGHGMHYVLVTVLGEEERGERPEYMGAALFGECAGEEELEERWLELKVGRRETMASNATRDALARVMRDALKAHWDVRPPSPPRNEEP